MCSVTVFALPCYSLSSSLSPSLPPSPSHPHTHTPTRTAHKNTNTLSRLMKGDGFLSIRYGGMYPNTEECGNSTFITTTNFECDSDAKFNISQPDITQYLTSIERPVACAVSLHTFFELYTTQHTHIIVHTTLT